MAKYFLLIFIVLIMPTDSLACSCRSGGKTQPVIEAIKNANAVFVGKVPDGHKLYDDVYFYVNRIWKGDIKRILFVEGFRGKRCDYKFEAGREYLVYGEEGVDGIKSSFCGRTKLLSDANDDIVALGDPIKVFGEVDR